MLRLFMLLAVFTLSVYTTETLPDITYNKIPMSEPTQVEKFMHKIALIESDNNHKVVNEFGMMGKYQFAPSTVRALGFRVSGREFLNNPELQDSVMVKYMKENQRELSWVITRYDGKKFNGVKVTRAGIIAAAHFSGTGGVVKYFREGGSGISDARGTTVKKYMSYFSDFSLPEI
jgi:Transglycosylase SLT domain